ncbi:MAG: thiol reductant ABC exporter subunit CydD [Solirubrobacteraceae bacterium]|nr:thiol reductant ABC exporter subunit CydD [Solirubrobacteraceae bacterium]
MEPVARRLLRDTRAARRPLAVSGLVGAVGAVLVVAQAVLLARVIAHVFIDGQSLGDVRGDLVALAAVVAGRGVVAALFDAVGRFGALRVMSELRARLGQRMLVARPTGLPGERAGELTTAVVQGVDALETFFARYLPQVMLSALVPVAVLAWVLPHDLPAGLILAVTIPLVPLFMALVGLKARDDVRKRERTLALLGTHFLDVVRGLRTLRAFGREHAQDETLARVGDRYRRETLRTLRVAFLSAFVLELLAMLGTALVAATVGIQLAQGHLELTVGLAVLLLAPELYAPLRSMGQQHHASADGLAAAERIFEVLDAPRTVAVPEHPRVAPDPARSPVVLEGVRLTHPGRAEPVLDGADLTLEPGELVALVGHSGAGKSTLATLLLRLADPDEGAVRCGGVDLRDVDADAWRARTAWAPQRGRLFAGTLAENLRLGAPGATDAELEAALAAADALEIVAGLPDGLDTRMGDGGRALSAGQVQRLVVARALVRRAPLLVLDEPTASLDAPTAARVADGVLAAARGRTTLLITHDPALAARADRVVALRRGRVVETPRPTAAGMEAVAV